MTAGTARAKVVTAGSLSCIVQALGLLEDAGAAHARSYEHTTLAVFGLVQATPDSFEQWPWSEGPAYALGIGEFSGGELEVDGHEPIRPRGRSFRSTLAILSV